MDIRNLELIPVIVRLSAVLQECEERVHVRQIESARQLIARASFFVHKDDYGAAWPRVVGALEFIRGAGIAGPEIDRIGAKIERITGYVFSPDTLGA